MHGEQQRRSVEEGDREHVERVVEEIAVIDRELVGPVEMPEDAERHGFAPAPHQQRADEAEHEIEPDRRGEGPGDVRAHPELARALVHAHPPQKNRGGEEEAGHQPPAALLERREDRQSVLRQRRLEREPEQLADELDRVPVHRGQHVEADDLDRDDAADDRQKARRAEIESDRSARRRSCRASRRRTAGPGAAQAPAYAGTPNSTGPRT